VVPLPPPRATSASRISVSSSMSVGPTGTSAFAGSPRWILARSLSLLIGSTMKKYTPIATSRNAITALMNRPYLICDLCTVMTRAA
jgi:hypothetical protein